jgi:hypothetical protein
MIKRKLVTVKRNLSFRFNYLLSQYLHRKPTKIGLITNLIRADEFSANDLENATASEWMIALGGNTGNLAFVEGTKNIIGTSFDIIGWGDDPKAINRHYDHLVICCANQLGEHVDLGVWAKVLTEYNLPVTLIGLGAQADSFDDIPSLPEGTIEFLNVVDRLKFNRAQPNIITRGEYTTSLLSDLGYESAPLGCPSQFISNDPSIANKLGRPVPDAPRILVPAGNPWHQSRTLESTLIKIVQKHNGKYLLQNPESLFKVALGELSDLNKDELRQLETAYPTFGSIKNLFEWLSSNAIFFADIKKWLEASSEFHLALGPRYHGIAIAVQAGTPGKVITIDSRTEELCQGTGMPYLDYHSVSKMPEDELIQKAAWCENEILEYISRRRLNARQYISFLRNNGIMASSHLENILYIDTAQED